MPKLAPSPRRAFLYDHEIAALFRVAASTPRYWRFIGRLPTVKVGRRAAVPRSAVAALAASSGLGIADHEIDAAIDGHLALDTNGAAA